MNVLIPLCGKGIRFRNDNDCSTQTSKHMIKIFDKEMICYVLDMIKNSISKEDNVYIIHYSGYDIDSIIKKYPFVKTKKIDHYTRGAAETIHIGLYNILRDNPETDFHCKCLVLDCDTYYTTDILNMARDCETNGVFYFQQSICDNNNIFSYIKIDHENTICCIAEKERISNNANTGAYLFHKTDELLSYTKDTIEKGTMFNNEFYTSCVIHRMIQDKHVFKGIEIPHEHVVFLGTPEQVKDYIKKTFAFLMDLDGTIVNTDKIYKNVWKELLQYYNIEMTDEIYNKYIQGNNDCVALSNIFSDCIPFELDELSYKKDELFINNINLISIIPNSTEFIKNIKLLGHKVAIVSNCNRLIAEKILEHIGIYDIVDCIVIGNECEKPKPYPHPYMKALSILNVPNQRAIIFEDSSSGILSAKCVFPCCIVGVYNNDPSTVEKYKTDFMINNYADIDVQKLIGYEKNHLNEIEQLLLYNKKGTKNAVGFKVDSNKLKGGFIADVLNVEIVMEDCSVHKCVFKIKNNNITNMSKMANMLDLYEREFYFYQNIAPYVNVCVPHAYMVVKDQSFQSVGILLENLSSSDYTLNLDLNNEHIDTSLKVIRRMAELHKCFYKENLMETFPLLKKHNDGLFCPSWGNFISEKWETFKQNWGFLLTEKRLALTEAVSKKFNRIQEYLSSGNLTLCHGDIKSANIFYKKINDNKEPDKILTYEPYFIDWQYIAYGKGVQDLVFFMIESFDRNVIPKYNSIFKRYYYECFTSYNEDVSYTFEEFERDFMIAACYFPFFVAIWFGTTNKNDIIDTNFPFFYIQKYLSFIENNVDKETIESL